MKILVTGFDPFGESTVNPAIEAVKRLPDEILGAQIGKLKVPTVCFQSVEVIDHQIARWDPDVVISVGQAGGRADLTVERIGINIDDCRIPDNEGNQFIDQPIVPGGPAAYFVTLPIKAMVAAIQARKIPASVSNSAGTFVCNHVTYGVAHLMATKYPGKKSGFIHVPYLPEQVLSGQQTPSMSLELIVQGLIAAIEAVITNDQDIKVLGGSLH